MNLLDNFQFILLSDPYDAIGNPLRVSAPWQGNKLNSRSIGCRWQFQGAWVTKFNGFPEQDIATIAASPLPDYSAVVIVELERDETLQRRDNVCVYEPDGSLRERLDCPLGPFFAISFEGGVLGFLGGRGTYWDTWVEYDHVARKFGRSHPVK